MSKYRVLKWWERVKRTDQWTYSPPSDRPKGYEWPDVEGKGNGRVGCMVNLPLFLAQLKFRVKYPITKPPYIRRLRHD